MARPGGLEEQRTQGISEAMNCSVFGLLGCLPISLAILGYAFVRARRDRGA